MNASKFMDKQIMELSGSGAHSGGGGGDLLELLGENHQDNGAGGKKDEILPSYDFQPIRTVGSSAAAAGGTDGGRTWGSADSSKASGSNFRAWNYGSLEAHDSSKVIHEKHKEANDASMMVEFDRTVKKYADNLLHALEGVSSRLSQLEGRTHNLESAVGDLKLSVANNNGSTDGKLRQLENILREVQTGVQVLRDKQEIAETQMQLAKMQTTKGDHQRPDNPTVAPSETRQPQVPPPQQPPQQPAQPLVAAAPPPPAPLLKTQLPALPMPPAPNAPPPQNPPPGQFSSHVSQPQLPSIPPMPPREPYFAPPGLPLSEVSQQPYQPPPQPQLPPPQQYQPASQLQQYSQPAPSSQPVPPPHPQASVPHHPEEPSPYMPPPQTYHPSIHQPPQLPPGPLPPHQFHGSSTTIYEPPKLRPTSGQQPFSAGYGPPSGPGFSDSYPYSGSPSQYSSGMKPSPFSSSTPRLPTAQLLPQAAPPTASSSSSSSGDRVPIDDVVDKVSTMGFPRDVVRATVRRLTENGQNVDLNVVLDKLMNDSENQLPKGWFGR
ncbi:hypothetical protein Taro_004921 [Colocasia esculenta]|uniref:DUF1421 domain-containing protein n=1 Tax=Colocasia esculenta TaxID=4460 RepID=A0A843TWF7_COLES|nr:hypothetical protein [Colocasia esculenta]